MRFLVLLGDGMADYPLPDHQGQTPLALAQTPAMDAAVQHGLTGLLNPIPEGLPAGSDVGNLSIFGYDPRATFTGRAPLEAANQGIALGPADVAFRCNLVTLEDGVMVDFTAGHITSEEARALVAALDEAFGPEGVRFNPGVSYRHLAILDAPDPALGFYADLACTPPHDITGQPFAPHLPQGPGQDRIRDLMARSQDVLREHPVNAARRAAGKAPATSIWLWGQGRAPRMTPFPELYGLDGAVISAVDLVNGIGVCAGLEVVPVEGATGYLDTNYAGKAAAALDALECKAFVFVHVEAPDETSHQGDLALKIRAIEEFDRYIVAPCLEYALDQGDCRVLITPDHITALSTKTHAAGRVPFALCGAEVAPDAATAYDETCAAASGLVADPGCALLPVVLEGGPLDAEALKQRLG